jgi:hypothetical protein
LKSALREGAKQMTFMDKSIEVDRNAGIFVTLNPAGKGYGGRSKLPDNLKQLFRYPLKQGYQILLLTSGAEGDRKSAYEYLDFDMEMLVNACRSQHSTHICPADTLGGRSIV